ncbi:MAG: methionine--tRNA ligase [Armatimonadota bacterium]|nr:methionine--tRNA ligase [Armatimonadota bacterium]MDW8026122.1 methionine--tRNA ligase [Armatimonadota bacterium]
MRRKFYITTPIYYVNDVPHIGTAYCTIAADIIARYHRLLGEDVFFLTGTDENAIKVARAAQEHGKHPQEFVDELAQQFQDVWKAFNISYDDFIRTTQQRHRMAVVKFIEQITRHSPDVIYPSYYEGWYCVFEETFYTDEEIVDGKCPECGRQVQLVREPAFYFRLSSFSEKLLRFYEEHPEFLAPDFRGHEVISFVRSGLKDVAITRVSKWGIPFPISHPESEGHMVVYVWFDALVNYLSGIGYGSDEPEDVEKFNRYWPADLHLVGKDIYTRFHCTMWPAMLIAAGLELPRCVFGHGFWNIEGEKMSKSKGNVIEPVSLANEIVSRTGCTFDRAVDAIRYFLFREVSFGLDGDFQRANLYARFNSDLANDLGNLVQRVLVMVRRFIGGKVPPLSDACGELRGLLSELVPTITQAMDGYEFSQALSAIWEVVRSSNRFIERRAPWQLSKEGRRQELQDVLRELLDVLSSLAIMLSPFMPSTAFEIARQMGACHLFDGWRWEHILRFDKLPDGLSTSEPQVLFPKGEIVHAGASQSAQEGEVRKAACEGETTMGAQYITIDEFKRLDLRAVKVVHAEQIQGADKLLKLEVDMGTERRTVVAGIAQEFAPEELIGKTLVLVANLTPAKIRGVISQGMILAAGEDKPLALVTLDREVPPGTKIS